MSTVAARSGRLRLFLAVVGPVLGSYLGSRPALAAPPSASAAPPRTFVVLREHGAGTPSSAQPHLDRLLAVVGEQNHWPQVSGRYFNERPAALEFVRQQKPEFGILSLAAFVSLKASLSLTVIGEVVAPKAGGTRYSLVSKRGQAVEKCAGRRVATTYASDPKFIDRVVSGGAFRLADFTVIEARRPLEPLKQVLRGEADCALIDDAQLEAARHIEQGAEIAPLWQSAELPGMAVVAFPRASGVSVASLKASLGTLCSKATDACKNVGIDRIQQSSESRYQAVVAAYSKP